VSREQNHITIADQLGREVAFRFPPRRLVSLCPSLTETLFDLGVGDRIVGRTTYCIHPAASVKHVPDVGGVKDFDLDLINSLKPDLVIAAKEENPRELIEELAESCPVFVLEVVDYDSALLAMETLGRLTDTLAIAEIIVRATRTAFAALTPAETRRAAYLVWREPYICAGENTFIHAMLGMCGLVNACAGTPERYPRTTVEALRKLSPDWIMLSSEPYSFTQAHADELTRQIPNARITLVDGEMFAWYGSRMRAAARYFQTLVG